MEQQFNLQQMVKNLFPDCEVYTIIGGVDRDVSATIIVRDLMSREEYVNLQVVGSVRNAKEMKELHDRLSELVELKYS